MEFYPSEMKVSLLFFLSPITFGYVFDCLDNCECDTNDEVIHCHNGERTELALPKDQRLRGFPIIGLTYNNIVKLPNEETLLLFFPDLKIVDVERNLDFDCDSVQSFDRVKIISDCNKNISEISQDCDLKCQTERHYQKLHGYVLNLWEVLKEKYNNFDVDETLSQIKEFFLELVDKVNKLAGKHHKNRRATAWASASASSKNGKTKAKADAKAD